MLKACNSKNHLLVLEALYDRPAKMKKIKSVNYKTTARIIKQFTRHGLVVKNRDYYSLSNKGRLIACFLLGKFNDLKPEIKTEFILDKDEVYIQRKDIVEEVLYNLERKRSTLILGESGMGKTTLLKHLQQDYLKNSVLVNARPASNITEKLAQHLSIPLVTTRGRRKRMFELLDDIVRKASEDLIVIIDEVEEATKQTKKIIKLLQRSGLTILGAGTSSQGINFSAEVRLRGFTNEEASELIHKLIKNSGLVEYENELAKIGNPEELKNACEDLLIAHKMGDLKDKAEYKSELKSRQLKKINLVSTYDLVSLGYLLITLRYVFYGQKMYSIGYLLSTVAYMMFFLFRRKRKKK